MFNTSTPPALPLPVRSREREGGRYLSGWAIHFFPVYKEPCLQHNQEQPSGVPYTEMRALIACEDGSLVAKPIGYVTWDMTTPVSELGAELPAIVGPAV